MSVIQWAVAVHVAAVIVWVGGLLGLVHVHAQACAQDGTRAGMARAVEHVFESLVHPALMLVLATGIFLVFLEPSLLARRWLHAKLVLVAGLIAMDVRAFRVILGAADRQPRGATRAHVSLRAGIAASLLAILILTSARSC